MDASGTTVRAAARAACFPIAIIGEITAEKERKRIRKNRTGILGGTARRMPVFCVSAEFQVFRVLVLLTPFM